MICHVVSFEGQDRKSMAVACPVTQVSNSETHAYLSRKTVYCISWGNWCWPVTGVHLGREIRVKYANYIGRQHNYRLE